MWRAKAMLSIAVLSTLGSVAVEGRQQQGSASDQVPPGPHAGDVFGRPSPPDAAQTRLQEQQVKSRNDERQKKLVTDTAKLYDLAGQLKDQVARSDKNTLSVDVIKKAEEIERLARSVKDRMRG